MAATVSSVGAVNTAPGFWMWNSRAGLKALRTMIRRRIHDCKSCLAVSRSNNERWFWRLKNQRVVPVSASLREEDSSYSLVEKRKVIDHISLIKSKKDLTDENEQDMLDYLYTTQYQMRGVLAVSVGRISDDNVENYTHAVYMRFQRKEDVAKFYENPFYLKVLKEHVMPYCHGLMSVDYESEVEDDILPIFRKGEEFNFGEEFVHLFKFDQSASSASVEEALKSLQKLTEECPSLVVQSTHGSNFNNSSVEDCTHAEVTRFRSLEAFEMFVTSTEYKDLWRLKFEPIIIKSLPIHFSVDPVGKEIM